MNYAEMSDFEINKAVHLVLLKKGKIKEQFRISPSDFVDVFRNSFGEPSVIAVMRYVVNGSSDGYNPFGGAFNYCNNPSDAWPIIVENKTYNANSGSLRYLQDGKLTFDVYTSQLRELDVDISFGDYIGYIFS